MLVAPLAARRPEDPTRLRIAMLTGAQQHDVDRGAGVHLDRLAFQLTRMGHSVDLGASDPVAGLVMATSRIGRAQRPHHDIAHALSLSAGPAALRLQQSGGVPFVLSLNLNGAAPHWLRTSAGACNEADAPALRAASRILAPSPQHSRQLERLLRIAPERIHPALRGFAPEELWPQPMTEARVRLGLPQHRFLVLHLGPIAPRKGIDTLIQGIALLRRRHAVDAGLLVVGGAAGESVEPARLAHIAAELGVGAHVHFAGPQPRASLRDYYAAANVFAATPWYEPFGLPPLEAMACARPVVASELGAIGELVDDGRTGFLIPSRDPDALADRLARLHRHPQLAQTMGEAGRRRACEHHTWQRQAAQLLALYRDILREVRQSAHPLAS